MKKRWFFFFIVICDTSYNLLFSHTLVYDEILGICFEQMLECYILSDKSFYYLRIIMCTVQLSTIMPLFYVLFFCYFVIARMK